MDYPRAKFGYFRFRRFGFIVRTDAQTELQNHRRALNAFLTLNNYGIRFDIRFSSS